MMTRKLLVLSLLILPLAAEAQRGRGGSRGGSKRANYNIDTRAPITISNKDVESLSPVRVLLDKKKDLALTDEQLKGLKDLEGTLKAKNDTLFRQLDSLRKEMRENKNATNPQVEQMRVRGARSATVEVIKAIRDNYEGMETEVLAVLAESQQKAANELLDKHQQEAEEMLQEKLGGGKKGG